MFILVIQIKRVYGAPLVFKEATLLKDALTLQGQGLVGKEIKDVSILKSNLNFCKIIFLSRS